MKQFNLEEYIRLKAEGQEPKIVTREGHDVRVLCTNVKTSVPIGVVPSPILTLVDFGNYESPVVYTPGGKFCRNEKSPFDLFFADDIKEKTL